MVDCLFYTFIDEVIADEQLDASFREELTRKVVSTFTSLNSKSLNIFKESGELSLVQNYSEYERLTVFFMARNPLVYHRIVELLYCGQDNDSANFTSFGMIHSRAHNLIPVELPLGRIARALVLQLRELIAVSGRELDTSLQMMVTDTTFSFNLPRFINNRRKPVHPLIIFTMDLPGQFTEAIMLSMRSLIHAALGFELCREQSFSYACYKFELPDCGTWAINPCWRPRAAAPQ